MARTKSQSDLKPGIMAAVKAKPGATLTEIVGWMNAHHRLPCGKIKLDGTVDRAADALVEDGELRRDGKRYYARTEDATGNSAYDKNLLAKLRGTVALLVSATSPDSRVGLGEIAALGEDVARIAREMRLVFMTIRQMPEESGW